MPPRSIARNLRHPPRVRGSMSGRGLEAAAAPARVGGSVTLSTEAIAELVGLTVLECYGVVRMAAMNLSQGVARLLSRERLTQGIGVRREPSGLAIDLYVVIEYGLNLAEVAVNLRSRVHYTVEK